MQNKIKVGGNWVVECRNRDGSLAWREPFRNAATTVGLNDMLTTNFAAGTQKPNWYFGLIDNVGFSTLAASDTMSSHAGWSENTSYAEADRQAWTPGAAASGSVINPTPAVCTANAAITIKGAFLVSENTKGGTSGILWATGLFASPQVVSSGQTLSLQCQVPLTAT